MLKTVIVFSVLDVSSRVEFTVSGLNIYESIIC